MAVVIESTSVNVSSDASTSAVANKPTGTIDGDLVIVWIDMDDDDAVTAPDGTWTQIGYSDMNACSQIAFWKEAGASEPSSWTFTIAATEKYITRVARISGHDTANPINASAVTQDNSAPETDIVCPAVTTDVSNCLIIYSCNADNDRSPFTHPPGTTEISEQANLASGETSSAWSHKTLSLAGSSGVGTFTVADVVQRCMVTIAITPSVSTTQEMEILII